MKYIDTHAHIASDFFEEDLNLVLKEAENNNIKYILLPGTTIEDSIKGLELSKKHEILFAGFGIHPSDADDEITKKLDSINIDEYKFIGETGIDLFHDTNPPLEVQQRSFRKHLELARKFNKTVEIHTRDAYQEVYEIIKDFKDVKMVMHSFTGNLE